LLIRISGYFKPTSDKRKKEKERESRTEIRREGGRVERIRGSFTM
jgi:hypothetical protein